MRTEKIQKRHTQYSTLGSGAAEADPLAAGSADDDDDDDDEEEEEEGGAGDVGSVSMSEEAAGAASTFMGEAVDGPDAPRATS